MDLLERILKDLRLEADRLGRVWITLTYAQSLDGCITLQRGRPFALSSAPTALLTHQLRATHEAILVGVGTVLADNPRLTARLAEGPDPQPVILDSRLRTPLHANLLGGARPAWIVTTEQANAENAAQLEAAGARLFYAPSGVDGRVDLAALLGLLAEQGLGSLMVEGGAQVITSFLSEKLADGLVLTCAPVILAGLPAVEKIVGEVADRAWPAKDLVLPQLAETHVQQAGPDLVVWGRLVYDTWKVDE